MLGRQPPEPPLGAKLALTRPSPSSLHLLEQAVARGTRGWLETLERLIRHLEAALAMTRGSGSQPPW